MTPALLVTSTYTELSQCVTVAFAFVALQACCALANPQVHPPLRPQPFLRLSARKSCGKFSAH